MTKTEWNKVKRGVSKHGYYIFSDRSAIYSSPSLNGKVYIASDKEGLTTDTSWNIDDLRYLFD